MVVEEEMKILEEINKAIIIKGDLLYSYEIKEILDKFLEGEEHSCKTCRYRLFAFEGHPCANCRRNFKLVDEIREQKNDLWKGNSE